MLLPHFYTVGYVGALGLVNNDDDGCWRLEVVLLAFRSSFSAFLTFLCLLISFILR